MFDLRTSGYVIGMLIVALGATMLVPMIADIASGSDHWPVFGLSSLITCLIGSLIALGCANVRRNNLTIQQTFFLTTGVWVILPVFGALPFVMGHTDARC